MNKAMNELERDIERLTRKAASGPIVLDLVSIWICGPVTITYRKPTPTSLVNYDPDLLHSISRKVDSTKDVEFDGEMASQYARLIALVASHIEDVAGFKFRRGEDVVGWKQLGPGDRSDMFEQIGLAARAIQQKFISDFMESVVATSDEVGE